MLPNLTFMMKKEEGWRATPYYCSENYPTVGYGFKLGERNAQLPKFELPQAVGDAWLQHNLQVISTELAKNDWYNTLNLPRRAVFISMAYQMGIEGTLKFEKAIEAIKKHDFETAADELLDSKWATQTPMRAERHTTQMRSGEWNQFYLD